MHLGEPSVDSVPELVPIGLSGPQPTRVPAATAWEWGAMVAVPLDGRSLRGASPFALPDRAVVALVGALAIAAAVLATLLV